MRRNREIVTERPALDKLGNPLLDAKGVPIVTREIKRSDMMEHRKLRIDTRIRLMTKLMPKSYGDKLEHTGEIGIKTVIVPAPAKSDAARPAATPDFEE